MTTEQIKAGKEIAELKKITPQMEDAIYRGAKAASRCLQDATWLARHFDGDEVAAAEHLQSDYFAWAGDLFSLWDVIQAYRWMPERSQWAEYRYNVQAILARHEEATTDEAPKRERHSYKKEANELREACDGLRAQIEVAKTEANERVAEATSLAARCHALEQENARLRGRIEELERLVPSLAGAR